MASCPTGGPPSGQEPTTFSLLPRARAGVLLARTPAGGQLEVDLQLWLQAWAQRMVDGAVRRTAAP
eukprot:5625814-Lingulodinium_polyedra.AAC.1